MLVEFIEKTTKELAGDTTHSISHEMEGNVVTELRCDPEAYLRGVVRTRNAVTAPLADREGGYFMRASESPLPRTLYTDQHAHAHTFIQP